jgi:hypothetical protein
VLIDSCGALLIPLRSQSKPFNGVRELVEGLDFVRSITKLWCGRCRVQTAALGASCSPCADCGVVLACRNCGGALTAWLPLAMFIGALSCAAAVT